MIVYERLNSRQRIDEIVGELRMGDFADDDEQCYPMPHDCFALVRYIANSLVVRQRNAPVAAAMLEPLRIRACRRE